MAAVQDKIGNYLTLGGDALGRYRASAPPPRGSPSGSRPPAGPGAAAGVKVGVSTGARAANYAAKAVDPALPLISKPVEAVATKLGASVINAQRISDGVQAGAALAWTAPTAYSIVRPGEGATRAANWGTTIGNIGGGVGGGKFGSIAAVGSAIGLGVWETR
ncbi:hypothetical protein NKH77_32190 [Streptomyces sp. M19]